MLLTFDNLLVNENAYFYKIKRPLVKSNIEQLFAEALSHKKASAKFTPRIRESYVHGGKEIAKVSILVFEFRKRPSFLTKDVNNTFEVKYGLFIIIEGLDFMATIRKNVSGIESLYSLTEKIGHNTLSRFLVTKQTKYEMMVTDNMNPANTVINTKTSEGADLQNTYSRFYASKQIIKRIRLEDGGRRSGIAITTSRVNSFNIQNEFAPTVIWIVDIIKKLRNALKSLPTSSFIDSFATPVEYDEIIDDLNPAYLLLRFDTLKDDIENSRVTKAYSGKTRKRVNLDNEIFSMSRLVELKRDGEGIFVNGDLQIRVRPKYLHMSSNFLKDIVLEFEDDSQKSLNDFINSHHHFIVIFDKLEYVYSHGTIFKDNRLLGDINSFLTTFVGIKELENVDSEKGEGYSSSSSSFSSKSLFHITETVLCKNAEFLVCDDMGVEWGDFISIDQDDISFYHLKHNKEGLSPKNLQDVFGQVQKNFGVLQLTEELLDLRKSKWESKYKINNVTTNISRIRKSVGNATFANIKSAALLASSNANTRKRVIVVVNFISRSALVKMLENLKKGKSFHNQAVAIQMLWFVHGVLALAQELGAEFKIFCRP